MPEKAFIKEAPDRATGGPIMDDERLRRLLDGDIDAGQLASDGVLASIADRVYGIKVDPAVRPTKPRDAAAIGAVASSAPEPAADLLVEVIPGGAPSPLPAVPDLTAPPMPALSKEDVPSQSGGGSTLLLLGLLGLAVLLTNLYWGLGNVIDACTGHVSCSTSMKLNWLDVHRTADHVAWGPTGVWGIPDMVGVGVTGLMTLLGMRRR